MCSEKTYFQANLLCFIPDKIMPFWGREHKLYTTKPWHQLNYITWAIDFHFVINFITTKKVAYSLGPVHEFVCISFRTGNLNCFRVKWP